MGSAIGGIVGNIAAQGDEESSKQALQDALNNIKNINTPSIEEQEIALEKEKSAGLLSPEQEQALKEQETGLNNISVNPALRAAQMEALTSLQNQGRTGLTASDRNAINQTENQLTQQANSANQSVLQQMAQRGQGSAGASLAAQLANNQNSAATANQRALQVAGQAQQNALNATAQAGTLGNQLENSQYSEAANAAKAQDAINAFNTQNAQNISNTNTQAGNQAQAFNLNNAQNISNTNTNLSNQQQQYNKGLYQQQFNNQLNKAKAESGAENNISGYYGNQANLTRQEGAAIGNGVQQVGMAIATGGASAAMPGGGGSGGGSTATSGNNFGAGNYFSGSSPSSNSGGYNLGYAHGGLVKGPTPGNQLSIFKMLSDGGQVQPLTHQQVMEAIQRGANALAAKPAAKLYDTNGVGAEDAAEIGQEQEGNTNMAAQLAKFNAANGRPQVAPMAKGGMVVNPGLFSLLNKAAPQDFTSGGKIPGKEVVPGDSPKNDTVPIMASAGEVMLPKTIAESDNSDVIMAFLKGVKSGKGK